MPEPPVEDTCQANGQFNVGNAGAMVMKALSAFAPADVTMSGFRVGRALRPAWLHPLMVSEAIEKDGVVAGFLLFTAGVPAEKAVIKYLRGQYGKPSSDNLGHGARRVDWALAGLHVSYTTDTLSQGGVLVELDSYRQYRAAHQGARTE